MGEQHPLRGLRAQGSGSRSPGTGAVLAKLLGWFVGFAPCPVLVALGNAAVPRPEA